MSFQKRKQWESMFEDGVIVEGIETGIDMYLYVYINIYLYVDIYVYIHVPN